MTTEDILTERLTLRSTREADGPFCLSIWLDDEMGKYLADPPRSKADEAELNFAAGIEQDEDWYPFVVELRRTGEQIGTCSLAPGPDNVCWDLGYCVHRDHWRQGYATEMIQAMIDFGRSRGGKTFTATVAKENPGSNAVLRKLGFRVEREGSFRKRCTDIVYEDWHYRLDVE